MNDWITDEHRADWREDEEILNDSGHDAVSIEQDWQSEKQRVMRGFDGRDLLDALADNDTTLQSIAKLAVEGNDAAVGLMVSASVRKYVEDLADKSIFGRITRRNF